MGKDKTSKIVWIITIVLALGMLGAAVYVSRQAQPDQAEPQLPSYDEAAFSEKTPIEKPPEPAYVPPEPSPEPTPDPVVRPEPAFEPETVRKVVPVEDSTAGDEQVKDVRRDKSVLALDLSNLAGTMKAQMKLTGGQDKKIPLRHTCYRHNYSPALDWGGAPAGTQSFAVLMERNDKIEGDILYWALFNVPADANALSENVPKEPAPMNMKHALNDFSNPEYTGPCERDGRHNYTIRILALDVRLDQPAGIDKGDLVKVMNGHIIDMAEIGFVHYF